MADEYELLDVSEYFADSDGLIDESHSINNMPTDENVHPISFSYSLMKESTNKFKSNMVACDKIGGSYSDYSVHNIQNDIISHQNASTTFTILKEIKNNKNWTIEEYDHTSRPVSADLVSHEQQNIENSPIPSNFLANEENSSCGKNSNISRPFSTHSILQEHEKSHTTVQQNNFESLNSGGLNKNNSNSIMRVEQGLQDRVDNETLSEFAVVVDKEIIEKTRNKQELKNLLASWKMEFLAERLLGR